MDSHSPISRKHALGVVWLTVFIDLIGFSIIFPLFPAMLDWYLPREGDGSLLSHLINFLRSLSTGENGDFLVAVLFGGILGSLYSILQFLASPFWGRLSDRFGRRKVLLWTTGGTALGYFAWIFAESFIVLILARMLSGIMAGNIAVGTAAVADLTSKADRAKGMALIGIAFGLGFILGPALGGYGSLIDISSAENPQSLFGLNPFSFPALLACGLGLINFLWVCFVFPETGSPEPTLRGGLFSLRSKNLDIRRALRVYFLFIIAFSGMEFTLTFLALERLHYAPEDMPLMFVFIGGILILSQGYLVRKYASRWGERNFVSGGLLSGFLGLVILSYAVTSSTFYMGLALLGLGIGCSSPALTALVSQYAQENEQGGQLGVLRSTGALGRAIGPIAGATLYWYVGSQHGYIIGAVVLLLASLLSHFLPKSQ